MGSVVLGGIRKDFVLTMCCDGFVRLLFDIVVVFVFVCEEEAC